MGEAKRRGTYEERKAQAIARDEQRMEMSRQERQEVSAIHNGRRAGKSTAAMALALAASVSMRGAR